MVGLMGAPTGIPWANRLLRSLAGYLFFADSAASRVGRKCLFRHGQHSANAIIYGGTENILAPPFGLANGSKKLVELSWR